MLKHHWLLAIALSAVLGVANAAEFDGSKVLICAPATTTKCSRGSTCSHGEARDFDLARFIEFDVANKTVKGVHSDAIATIGHVAHDGGQLIMHGTQNARGWTATVAEDTGEFTAAVAGENVAFAVFGACMVAK